MNMENMDLKKWWADNHIDNRMEIEAIICYKSEVEFKWNIHCESWRSINITQIVELIDFSWWPILLYKEIHIRI